MRRSPGPRARRGPAGPPSRSVRSTTKPRANPPMALRSAEIEGYFRREYGRCVATLIRFFGDIDVAEEAVQDAFAVALRRWPETGLPPNPGAWITTTARHRAIDQLRREASRHDRHARALLLHSTDSEP